MLFFISKIKLVFLLDPQKATVFILQTPSLNFQSYLLNFCINGLWSIVYFAVSLVHLGQHTNAEQAFNEALSLAPYVLVLLFLLCIYILT